MLLHPTQAGGTAEALLGGHDGHQDMWSGDHILLLLLGHCEVNKPQLMGCSLWRTLQLKRHLYHLTLVNWTHGSGLSPRNKIGFISRWGSKQRNWPWMLGCWPSRWSAVALNDPGWEVKAIQIIWEVWMIWYI